MNRPHRSIEIFTMSALDLFVTAMGSFAILMMILYPYYTKTDTKSREQQKALLESRLLFSVLTVRVRDYEQFVKETNYVSIKDQKEERQQKGGAAPGNIAVDETATWQTPGYFQEPDFPVVNVSLTDARAFCAWLTKKERAAGILRPEQEYRLPTDEEWSAALGAGKYPWGDAAIPPANAGNFAGQEYNEGAGVAGELGKTAFRDDFQMVAPAGRSTPNPFGLLDMGGNVWQWVDSVYRSTMNAPEVLKAKPELLNERLKTGGDFNVTRGGAWNTTDLTQIRSDYREPTGDNTWNDTGFRCGTGHQRKTASQAMRRNNREINTLSISALDLFATAMGAFAIIMLILFPHYSPKPPEEPVLLKDPQPGKPFMNSLGMKFLPVPEPGALPASATAPAATPQP